MSFEYTLSCAVSAYLCALCTFAIFLKLSGDIGRESEIKAYRAYVMSIIIYDLAHAAWIWCRYEFTSIFLVAVVVGMSAANFCGYFWFIYVIRRIHKSKRYSDVVRILVAIPLVAGIFMVAMSVRTGWVFRYADDGTIVRGPLYMLHSVLTGSYIIAAFFHSLFAMLMLRTGAKKSELRVLLVLMICPLCASTAYAFIPIASDFPIFDLVLLFAVLAVFINTQESRIYTDALTGLNNRRHADEVLASKIKNVSVKNPLYLFLMDVDKFKQINDGYGHVEGDKALKIMADALRKVGAEQRGFIARWGGDEFIMIIEHQHLDSPVALISAIRAQLGIEAGDASLQYPISCSVGYAVCTSPDATISALVCKADAMLYEDKKNHCPMIEQPHRGFVHRFR